MRVPSPGVMFDIAVDSPIRVTYIKREGTRVLRVYLVGRNYQYNNGGRILSGRGSYRKATTSGRESFAAAATGKR